MAAIRNRKLASATRFCFFGALALALVATTACGSDDDDDGTGGKAGSAGSGGKAGSGGSGGSSASGGSGGSAGEGATGGGSAGTGGAAGDGSGGAAGDGTGGAAGGTSQFWERGTIGEPLDPANDDRLWGVTFGPGNVIYAVGYISLATGDKQMALVKYTAGGELDTTFGTGGIVLQNLSPYTGTPDDPTTMANESDPSVEEMRDVVVQSDGKIVVVARTEDPADLAPSSATPADIVFFRFNTDGSLDSTYGTMGKTIVNLGASPDDQVWGLDIDADDRVYAFASGQTEDVARTDADRYVIRMTTGGILDTTWATDGTASFDPPQGSLTGTAPVTLRLNDNQRHGYVLPDGSVISAGYTQVAGRNQVVLAKFTSAGILDVTFSGDGVARVAPFANGMAEAYGAALQYDGTDVTGFVTTGYGRVDVDSTTDTDLDMVSFRFNGAGEFDSSWGVAGAVVRDTANAEDRGRYTLALPDNRVLMFGTGVATGANKDAMVLLLEENGALAANFDATGSQLYDFGGDNDEFFAAALSPDGTTIVAVGYAGAAGALTNGNATFLLLPKGE